MAERLCCEPDGVGCPVRLDLNRPRGSGGHRIVADDVLARVSDLETSPGVLGLGPVPASESLEQLARRPDAFLLVIAG